MSHRRLAPAIRRLFATAGQDAGGSDGAMLERYVSGGEAAAFEALIDRHGPLVLGVCRRVLGDEHEAEDAFQATFLVLARRAGAIRKRQSVTSWLYGVAWRVASRLRLHAARRATQPLPADDVPAAPGTDLTVKELRAVLDEELNRLPEKYRAPLVLCYLEGKTKDEAAAALKWPTGTVSGRLARGRDLLRERLTRRGLAFSTALFVTLLSETVSSAAVPATLAGATTTAAVALAGGQSLASVVSPQVAFLVKGALRDMFWTKMKFTCVALTALLLAAGGAGVWTFRSAEAAPIPMEEVARKPAAKPDGAPARTFDSTQTLMVYRFVDGQPVRNLGATPGKNRRAVAIPADANWAVIPVGRQDNAAGMNGGGIVWGAGGAGIGGGGFGGGGPAFPGGGMVGGGAGFAGGGAGVGGGGAGVGGGAGFAGGGAGVGGGAGALGMIDNFPNVYGARLQQKLPRLSDKDVQNLASEIKRKNVAGLALVNRDFTDQNLALFKGLPSLQTLVLRGTSVTERGLPVLKDFPGLRHLSLQGAALTPASVAGLAECKKLQTLELHGDSVTDVVMASLGEIKGLKTLRLGETRLTPAGLKALAGLQNLGSQDGLETLELAGPAITDDGIAHLKNLAGLNTVRLHLTEITDAGLAHLKQVPTLRKLYVDCTDDPSEAPEFDVSIFNRKVLGMVGMAPPKVSTGKITDDGLKQLKDLKELTELGICSDALTDEGVANLSGLPALKRLRLGSTSLTDKALAALKPFKELEALELFDGKFDAAGVASLKELGKLNVLYVPILTPQNSGTKYVRGLAPRTKVWFGKPWRAEAAPLNMGTGVGPGGFGAGGFGGPGANANKKR